nr:YkvA family protein [Neobacillus sp. Marseille-Q6967]
MNYKKEYMKYTGKAKDYLHNPSKTAGLLKIAMEKAKTNKGSLGDAWEKLQLFFDLVKAYSKGDYRNISPGTILTVMGAILYFVSPIDIVPDFLVGMGILDDAAVIAYTLKKVSGELDEFKTWLKKSPVTTESPLD